MPKISIVINLDSRPQRNEFGGENLLGVCNEDFLTYGVDNKIKAFNGFDIETIVFIDKHLDIPQDTLNYLYKICDTVCIRRHTDEPSFNCYNYLAALSLCRGDIVCHVDQDTNIFVSGKEYVEELISHLDNHAFVSYPSYWSPKPVIDISFGHRTWSSTRFFLCKRETLDIEELKRCIREPEYAYAKYGDSPRRLNWLEHFLTLTNNDDCYYPPFEPEKGLIFSWGSYEKWVLRRLNELPYQEVKQWVESKGGVNYPCDVQC